MTKLIGRFFKKSKIYILGKACQSRKIKDAREKENHKQADERGMKKKVLELKVNLQFFHYRGSTLIINSNDKKLKNVQYKIYKLNTFDFFTKEENEKGKPRGRFSWLRGIPSPRVSSIPVMREMEFEN